LAGVGSSEESWESRGKTGLYTGRVIHGFYCNRVSEKLVRFSMANRHQEGEVAFVDLGDVEADVYDRGRSGN
jgi:hypothetical protein